jgi:GTP cyclohydrolase III
MKKATYELQRLDIFKHLNGRLYQVDAITWVGGDNYRITCIDDNDDLVDFPADVHTSFEIAMTYSKAGA